VVGVTVVGVTVVGVTVVGVTVVGVTVVGVTVVGVTVVGATVLAAVFVGATTSAASTGRTWLSGIRPRDVMAAAGARPTSTPGVLFVKSPRYICLVTWADVIIPTSSTSVVKIRSFRSHTAATTPTMAPMAMTTEYQRRYHGMTAPLFLLDRPGEDARRR
jgi:hypothetical protein